MKAKYTLIVPCYNEEQSIPLFYEAAVPVMDALKEPFEIIYVNDGSRDNSLQAMKAIAEKDARIKVINFSRNFGQQAAIFCGYKYAEGEAIISIDVDLQDPIEAVPLMIEKWKDGAEIVHGKRTARKGESLLKKMTSAMYIRFLEKVSGLKIPRKVGEFKLVDRKVADTLCSLPERDRYIRGLASWVGYKQDCVEFVRNERVAGTTNWTFKKLFKLAGGSLVSFTTWPLSLAMKAGLLLGFLSFAAFVTFIVIGACGTWLPLVAWIFPTITSCFAILFVLMGFNNIYTKRMYEEVQNRPQYIVSDTVNLDVG